jgi:hypothetical protein
MSKTLPDGTIERTARDWLPHFMAAYNTRSQHDPADLTYSIIQQILNDRHTELNFVNMNLQKQINNQKKTLNFLIKQLKNCKEGFKAHGDYKMMRQIDEAISATTVVMEQDKIINSKE